MLNNKSISEEIQKFMGKWSFPSGFFFLSLCQGAVEIQTTHIWFFTVTVCGRLMKDTDR